MATLTDAIREAYACAPAGAVLLDTLQVSHPSLESSLWLVRNLEDVTLYLETGLAQLFTACGFTVALPGAGDKGLQDLEVNIDNTNLAASDFIQSVSASPSPVKLTYRPYLANDHSGPQMDPPLVLYLSEVHIAVTEVQCRATFADIVNTTFPRERYTRGRFPSIGS